MKMKKHMRTVCLLMLLAMMTGVVQPAAAATQNVPTKVKRILSGVSNLTPIPETSLLVAQESDSLLWGVYDTDGKNVIPLTYVDMSYLAYDFLTIGSLPRKTYEATDKIPLDEINCHALLTLDGAVLTDDGYGAFKAFSPNWFAGFVLEEGTSADNDYKLDKTHFYRIVRCDIYYYDGTIPTAAVEEPAAPAEDADSEPGEEAAVNQYLQPVLSFSRAEYKDAAAHSDYLSIQDRNNAVTVYDSNGKAANVTAKDIKTSIFGVKNWMLVNQATGEMLMDGCSGVKEIQLFDTLYLQAERIDFQGQKWNMLLTVEGEEIMPLFNASVSSVSKDYAVLTDNATGKKGLYSCADKALLLTCDYDEILETANASDRFKNHGYIAVKKDDEYLLYGLKSGKLLHVTEAEAELQRYGITFYTTAKNEKVTKTQLIAPDGTTKELYCSIEKSGGSGYIMCANFSGSYTVINWYGKDLLPQKYAKKITITADDRFILNTKNGGYELYKLVK